MTRLLLSFFLMLAACGDDDRPGVTSDAGEDAPSGSDASPADTGTDEGTQRDGGDPGDGGTETDGAADSGPLDVGVDANDAAVDAPRVAPGPVQCTEDDACSGPVASCQRAAPGGVCMGCGTDDDCAGECFAGSCVSSCDSDGDCNAGFRCLGSGRCAIRNCERDAECGPYECRDGQCARWRCEDVECPAGFTCERNVCIEAA